MKMFAQHQQQTFRNVLCTFIIIACALALTVSVHAQDLVWAKRAGGSSWDLSFSIAVLSDGSALVTGQFWGTATFGPGEITSTTLTSAGADDIFVARYNPDGTLAWAKRAGGSDTIRDAGEGIGVLSDGSALVTGQFWGTATFGPGEITSTTLTSVGLADIFVARYNPNGTLAWAKRAGGSSWDRAKGIAVLPDGSSRVMGFFRGTATFGPGEITSTTLTSAGQSDIFVARYNPDGTLAWAKRAGSNYADVGYSIAVLSDGSSLVTGHFHSTATFGPGEITSTTLTSAGEDDIFVARYNTNGTLAWAKRAGGSSLDKGNGIAVLSEGSSLVTGHFRGTATFGPGESGETTLTSAGGSDMFIARYNPNGTLVWVRRAGGVDMNSGRGIAVLSDGSALVIGDFSGTATFGQGESGETTLTSTWANDIFVARYNPDGTLAWARRAGGGSTDVLGMDIAVLSDASALVTGYFSGTATFGPGETGETTLTSAGSSDIFVAKYTGAPPAHAHSYWSLYH